MRFKAIIFDMDGLLVESESVWAVAESDLLDVRGLALTQEKREQLVGLRLDEFMVKLCQIYPTLQESPVALGQELTERMLQYIPTRVHAQPGAHELVRWVAEQQLPRAIASSSPLSIIDATMEAMGWSEIFTLRCTADDDARGKPAPDVYLRAAKLLGVDPADCLTLEDSPNGSRAAVAAGMTCYAVPDRTHTRPDVLRTITPYVFDSLHDVLTTLKQG